MLKRVFITFMLCMGVAAFSSAALADNAVENIQQTVRGGITENQAIQKEIDGALGQAEKAMEEARTKRDDLRWTEYQIKKYGEYLANQKERIAELERQKVAIAEIQRALEPYLDEVQAELAGFVAADFPFLHQERTWRTEQLFNDLNDPNLTVSERASRLLDALRIEAGYGAALNVENTVMDLPNGKTVNARLFALGRLGLYYQTEDGKQSGWYDKSTGGWKKLSGKNVKELTRVLNIYDKKSVPALVNLPVGRPQ